MTTVLPGSIDRGLRPWLSRLVWAGMAVPVVRLSIAGIPFRYTQLLLQNQWFQRQTGLQTEPAQAARIVLSLEVLIGVVFFATGALIIWHKGQERLGLVAAFAFLASAATLPGMTDAVIDATMTTRWQDSAWFIYSLRALSTTLSILLFYMLPDGRLFPQWTKILAPIWVLLNVGWLLFPNMPFSMVYGDTFRATETASILVAAGWWVSGLVAQIARYRQGIEASARNQIRWMALGLGLAGLGYLAYLFLRPLHTLLGFDSDVYVIGRTIVSSLGFICLPLCITIAILRHRLWDIDVVVNRTLVYGILTAGTMAMYILVVGGLGALLPARGGTAVAFVATGLVAILFQPLRLRLQTAVDRLMYGQRDDPVGMLTHLAQQLEGVDRPERILPTLVESIALALKLPHVALWLPQAGGVWQPVAAWGSPVDGVLTLPLLYEHQEIGRLEVAPRGPGERFSSEDERLLATIARLSATTVASAQLSAELQRSRQQIVNSREEERRRLRRDLHDGLGPVLASLALQAETARELVETDAEETKLLLAGITAEAQQALAGIRRLVYDLRPPALDELGLLQALRQSTQVYPLQIEIEAPGDLPSLPAAVEVAAYRIAQEAIRNAAHHGRATHCRVRFAVAGNALRLTVGDDGVGLPDPLVSGVGLISMRERAAELGGALSICNRPGGGAEIRASLPLPEEGEHGKQ